VRAFVTGATGFVGRSLLPALRGAGVEVSAWVRGPAPAGAIAVPVEGGAEATVRAIDEADAIVNLAGEPIAGHRWTAARRRRLVASRVETTRAIRHALGVATARPRVLVSASAVGIYGDRGDEVLTESSPPGAGFLAELCQAWEGEALAAASAMTRVVVLRIGVVLGPGGGALEKMVPVFRARLGGRLGSGRQWMSWVHVADVVGAIRMALERDDLSGPINVVSPAPVRNAEFSHALGHVLHRPSFLRAPAFALRLALGEMADALLLSSQRVIPARLQAAGYQFRFPSLDAALADLLG